MPQTCELTPLKAGPVHLLWESDVVKNASESHICEPSLDVKVVVNLQVFFFFNKNNEHAYTCMLCAIFFAQSSKQHRSSSGVPRQRSRLLLFYGCPHGKPLSVGSQVPLLPLLTQKAWLYPTSCYLVTGFDWKQREPVQWGERAAGAAALMHITGPDQGWVRKGGGIAAAQKVFLHLHHRMHEGEKP